MKNYSNLKGVDRNIHDPQYYQTEKHHSFFDTYQSERLMEMGQVRDNGRVLFPNAKEVK